MRQDFANWSRRTSIIFYTYPVEAIENNWVHQSIESAFHEIIKLIDAGQAMPNWLCLFPVAHRKSLMNLKKLPKLLRKFEIEAEKITKQERADFLAGFRQQNKIPELLDGSVPVPTFSSNLKALIAVAGDICHVGFDLLGKLSIRKEHYKIIYASLRNKSCPFCGTEMFDAPPYQSEDEDHYLARSAYPLAAANFLNLVPMGMKCNQRHKGKIDLLHDKNIRRKALNPYGSMSVAISLIHSKPMGGTNGLPDWKTDFIPSGEEVDTWDKVFAISQRIRENILNQFFLNWMDELFVWFKSEDISANSDNELLSASLDSLVLYKTEHVEQGVSFFKKDVFQFVAHHFKSGNKPMVEMVRNCLPLKKKVTIQ